MCVHDGINGCSGWEFADVDGEVVGVYHVCLVGKVDWVGRGGD